MARLREERDPLCVCFFRKVDIERDRFNGGGAVYPEDHDRLSQV